MKLFKIPTGPFSAIKMDKSRRTVFLLVFSLAMMVACSKPYTPSIIVADNSYLVVEGLINTGQDSTFIKLSRTVKLSSFTTTKPELNAIVTVESDQNNQYTLQDARHGLYLSPPLNLSPNAKYRLRIKTSDGKEYLSDYVVAKSTPDIDSISYDVVHNGVQLYANTHDPQNSTRYYRWDFTETWEYVSYIQSFYKLGDDGLPEPRLLGNNNPDNIYYCYKTAGSQEIVLGSSAKLATDVIYKQPVTFLPAEQGKVSHGYSIFLKQYALTPEAFEYWQILKKNTEQLGSIFDAQPASLRGNIYNTADANEPVIGYISASSIKSKLLFVDPFDIKLSGNYYVPPPTGDACPGFTIDVAPENSFKERLKLAVGSGDSVLVAAIQPIGAPAPIAYYYATAQCADCRAKQPLGNNRRPVFWPY